MTISPAQDVNAEFMAERARQLQAVADLPAELARQQAEFDARMRQRIDAGEIRDNGDGTYRVLTGYDRNETLTTQQIGGLTLIVPQVGLDQNENGTYKVATRFPTWHNLGQPIPDGMTEIPDILALIDGDFDIVQMEPAYTFGGQLMTAPMGKINTRSTDGLALGIVGNGHVPIPPRDSLAFAQDILGDKRAIAESVGFLNDGRRMFLTMRVPDDVIVDADGINEHLQVYLSLLDSWDGSSQLRVVMSPWRIQCGNTERFATRDALSKWGTRHTRNARARIAQARETLGLTVRFMDAFAADETTLARTEVASLGDTVDALIEEIWGHAADDAGKREVTFRDRRRDRIQETVAAEARTVGRTAYAAERGFTSWFDNDIMRSGGALARANASFQGADDKEKDTVHRQLMTLTRR